nr:MFS transporter [uncultured Bartonella sp.]
MWRRFCDASGRFYCNWAYADRHGRKAAMLLTIIIMAAGSAIIGFAPPCASIGVATSLLIVLGRLLQGFSTGGEIGASTTLLMESAERHKRGFFVGWQFFSPRVSTLCGWLLAAFLMYYLSPQAMEEWCWRVPFWLALLIIPVGLYLRFHINDSYGVSPVKQIDAHPFKIFVTKHRKQALLGGLFIFPSTVLMYILVFFIPNYLMTVSDTVKSSTFLVSSYASVIVIIFIFLSGLLRDRLEVRKNAAIIILPVAFVATFIEYTVVKNLGIFFLFHTIAVGCLGLMMTFSTLIIIESFAHNIPATAVAVIYAFEVSIFGGTAQPVVTCLLKISDRNILARFCYIALSLLVGAIALVPFDEKRYAD